MVRGGKWLIGVGVGLLVLALLWLVFAVPALVRYPLDIDATPVYEGNVHPVRRSRHVRSARHAA